jgi:hypothetical protein
MYFRGENNQKLSKICSWSMVISCVGSILMLHCKSFIIAYCPKIEVRRDIEWLKQNKLPVGCANKSTFLKDYLIQVYDFLTVQVVDVENEQDIVDKFKSKKISALFTESPYAKVFLNKHTKGYTATTAAYKFGGMGFVSACNFSNLAYFIFD